MRKKLCIIFPAFNEEKTIGELINRTWDTFKTLPFNISVLVIDDGSTDSTVQLANKAGATVVSHPSNTGVGRAFQTGIFESLKAGADIIVNIDSDKQFEPETIPQLIEPILNDRADFTTASRFKDPATLPNMPYIKVFGNRMMSRLISKIAKTKLYDVSCGFRAYNRKAALNLNLWGDFTYTQESILDLSIKGIRIEEVPMNILGVRPHGNSKVASNVFNYGIRAIKIIVHTYRDFWPWHFFCKLSLFFYLPGFILLGFLLWHRLKAGVFSGHIWAGFVGGGLIGFGTLTLVTGLMADMLKRIRINLETLIYFHKKNDLEEHNTGYREADR